MVDFMIILFLWNSHLIYFVTVIATTSIRGSSRYSVQRVI